MSDENLLFGFAGRFPSSPIFDVTLSERFQIPTLESIRNCRIVEIPFLDSSRGVVAVGGLYSSLYIGIFDVNSTQLICQILGRKHAIWGLTCLSCERMSSNPILVSGSDNNSHLLVFDAITGSQLGQMQNPLSSEYTYRLLHVPEWDDSSDVFVGGVSGFVGRFDITRNRKIGEYSDCRLKKTVFGLSGVVSRNLLISASWDKTVRLWSRDQYSCQAEMKLSRKAYSCCFLEEKNLIVVGLSRGSVEVWDVRRLAERVGLIESVGQEGGSVNDIVGIDENRIVCGCDDGTVAVLDASSTDGRVLAKSSVPSCVFGVCVLGRRSFLDEKSEQREALLERWEFGVRIMIKRSFSLVHIHVEQVVDGVSPILVSSCFLVVG